MRDCTILLMSCTFLGQLVRMLFFSSSSSCKRVNTVRLGVWRSWSESKFSFIFLSVEKTSQQLEEKYHNHCSVFGIWAMTFFSSKWCLACLRYNNNVNFFFYTSRYFTGKYFLHGDISSYQHDEIMYINVVHTCETRAGTTLTDCFLWMLGWITGRKLSTTW